jgi:hypothetical protein
VNIRITVPEFQWSSPLLQHHTSGAYPPLLKPGEETQPSFSLLQALSAHFGPCCQPYNSSAWSRNPATLLLIFSIPCSPRPAGMLLSAGSGDPITSPRCSTTLMHDELSTGSIVKGTCVRAGEIIHSERAVCSLCPFCPFSSLLRCDSILLRVFAWPPSSFCRLHEALTRAY